MEEVPALPGTGRRQDHEAQCLEQDTDKARELSAQSRVQSHNGQDKGWIPEAGSSTLGLG